MRSTVDTRSMAVEGGDPAHAGAFGAGNKVGLGEVEAICLIDLDRPEQDVAIDHDDRR
jgi:hypothetical protein